MVFRRRVNDRRSYCTRYNRTGSIEAPPEPELRYEYQPTDAEGRSIGGKQVILYRTPDELAEKLRDQNISLVRKLRQVTKEARLGRGEDSILMTQNVSRSLLTFNLSHCLLANVMRFHKI